MPKCPKCKATIDRLIAYSMEEVKQSVSLAPEVSADKPFLDWGNAEFVDGPCTHIDFACPECGTVLYSNTGESDDDNVTAFLFAGKAFPDIGRESQQEEPGVSRPFKAHEVLLQLCGMERCAECKNPVSDDWQFKDFSNKNIVICPQCKTEYDIEELQERVNRQLRKAQREYEKARGAVEAQGEK